MNTAWIVACLRCKWAILVEWQATATGSCPCCSGKVTVCEAVRVRADVSPAEVYPWTPWIAQKAA